MGGARTLVALAALAAVALLWAALPSPEPTLDRPAAPVPGDEALSPTEQGWVPPPLPSLAGGDAPPAGVPDAGVAVAWGSNPTAAEALPPTLLEPPSAAEPPPPAPAPPPEEPPEEPPPPDEHDPFKKKAYNVEGVRPDAIQDGVNMDGPEKDEAFAHDPPKAEAFNVEGPEDPPEKPDGTEADLPPYAAGPIPPTALEAHDDGRVLPPDAVAPTMREVHADGRQDNRIWRFTPSELDTGEPVDLTRYESAPPAPPEPEPPPETIVDPPPPTLPPWPGPGTVVSEE